MNCVIIQEMPTDLVRDHAHALTASTNGNFLGPISTSTHRRIAPVFKSYINISFLHHHGFARKFGILQAKAFDGFENQLLY